jgi:CheY-like chemotaxis protein
MPVGCIGWSVKPQITLSSIMHHRTCTAGVGATSEIRAIEARMKRESLTDTPRSRILALTGMSSLEDKRRAFEAGVDG